MLPFSSDNGHFTSTNLRGTVKSRKCTHVASFWPPENTLAITEKSNVLEKYEQNNAIKQTLSCLSNSDFYFGFYSALKY